MKVALDKSRKASRRPPMRDGARGGAAVEFALVLPLFMMLVMGALDYGYFFFSDQVVTNAAREGARIGTLVDPGSIPPAPPASGQQTAATTAAKDAARAYMDGNGVVCALGGSTCITTSYTTPSGMPSIDVVIQYDYHGLTGFLPVILPKHVYAHAVMRWQ